MPALVNSRVGSFPGTRELEATTAWPRSRKNSRKALRMSETRVGGNVLKVDLPTQNLGPGPIGHDPMKTPGTAKNVPVGPFRPRNREWLGRIAGYGPHAPGPPSPCPRPA